MPGMNRLDRGQLDQFAHDLYRAVRWAPERDALADWADDSIDRCRVWMAGRGQDAPQITGHPGSDAPMVLIRLWEHLERARLTAERAELAELAAAARAYVAAVEAARAAEARLARLYGWDRTVPLVVDGHIVERSGDRYLARPVWIAGGPD